MPSRVSEVGRSVHGQQKPVTSVAHQFDYVRCEIEQHKVPGVVYDLNNSTNNQFNLHYIIQEDPKGPKQFVLQAWFQQTDYFGDASRRSKQDSLYTQCLYPPAENQSPPEAPVNTIGQGRSAELGARTLWTFGDRDSILWTVGARLAADGRSTAKRVSMLRARIVLSGGDVYGIPQSQMDDYGLFADLTLPWSERITVNVEDVWTIPALRSIRSIRW